MVMKKNILISLGIALAFTLGSLLYKIPCGFWDGLTAEGAPTGGQIICSGFPASVFDTAHNGISFGSLILNYGIYFVLSMIVVLFFKKVVKGDKF